MKEKLLETLPLFLGATLGVWLYYSILPLCVILLFLVILFALGVIARISAGMIMPKHPELSVRLWQGEVMAPMALIAAGGWASTWIVDSLPHVIDSIPLIQLPDSGDGGPNDPRQKRIEVISAALSTAVTAFIGALFLDAQKTPTGGNWPPAQIKKAMAGAFGPKVDDLKQSLTTDSLKKATGESDDDYNRRVADLLGQFEQANRAVYLEEISIDHPGGWSLSAALGRAKIIRKVLLKNGAT